MKKKDIRDVIMTAVKNCEDICDGNCGECTYDDLRYEYGCSWCKSAYKKELLEFIENNIEFRKR